MGKTYVFGDIHGCHTALLKILDTINPDMEKDRLVFLGDYINRGPDVKDVISTIIELRKSFCEVITLMGNHEHVLLSLFRGLDKELFLRMGGETTLQSYGITVDFESWEIEKIPDEHMQFFHELLLYFEDEEYIFVHAGLQPMIHPSQQTTNWLLWEKDRFVNTSCNFSKRVIYGHSTFMDYPRLDNNKIGIDTGAVYGGKLTCLILPDMEFIQSSQD